MNALARNILIGLAAAFAAALATVALPLLNHLMHGRPDKKEPPRIVAEVNVTRAIEPPKPPAQPLRSVQQPQRARPAPSNLQPGPRFAMDLAVMGSGGAAAPLELVNRKSGSGGVAESGVDEKPSPASPPPFRMPDEVRRREQDASLLLSFCVDASGRPYDIRVVQEKPPGLGLAAAGQEALRQTRFTPARKGNASVPFCGLEQPFEIRFSN
jgi:outer membrane biosynthesis protein TonB